MSEDKSKLQLIGEIAEANNKNLELIEEINEKEDEIERLKEDNKYLNKVNIELSTEKNRLNNIINELEKFLNELKIDTDNDIKYARSKNDDEEIIRLNREFNMTDMILVKLQELKGDGNNESVEI